MNFHLQSSKPRRRRMPRMIGVFLLIVVVLIGVNYVTDGRLSAIARAPLVSIAPITNAINHTLFDSLHNTLRSKRALVRERDELDARVRELELYALNNRVLASENKELRALYTHGTSTITRGRVARVLTHGNSYPYGTMLIARNNLTGSDDQQSLVFGEQNILIGTIVNVQDKTATVELLSAPGVEHQALVGVDDRQTAVTTRGIGNGNLVAEAPRTAEIRENDPVVFFAETTAIVGFVGNIETKATDAFQTLRIRTPINLQTLRFVRVE